MTVLDLLDCVTFVHVFAVNLTLRKTKSSEHLRTEGVSRERKARVR